MVLVNLIEKNTLNNTIIGQYNRHCIVYLVKPLAKTLNEVTREEPFEICLLKCIAD